MQKKTREQWLDERRAELGLSWDDLAAKAHITKDTLRKLRKGGNGYPRTIRNLEASLGWALGSITRIDQGRAPTVVATPTASVPVPAESDDPAVQLRAIRDRVGPTAFRLLVEALLAE